LRTAHCLSPLDTRGFSLLMGRRSRSLLACIALALGAGALVPATANGAPIDDKKAQAARLQDQIEANGERISALSEEFNAAQLQLDTTNDAIADAEARMKAAEDQSTRTRQQIGQRAALLYRRSGGASDLLPADDVTSVNEMSVRSKYSAVAADRDELLIDKLASAKADLAEKRKELDAKLQEAKALVDSISAKRDEIESANAEQQQLLSQVKGEIATLVRQEQQRRDAAARTAALARLSNNGGNRGGNGGGGGGGGADPDSVGRDLAPNIPAPSSRAQVAIDYALAQVGKPYRYAGVGPDAYDCSGLTMMAWAQAGVSMPHGSSGQYAMFPHIPFEQIQPGDLIVWGTNGNRHVAMYLGNGMQVAATHTGDFVRVQPVYGGWWGVARPG
jgi:cell wall-associated NlpC family hydrolase